MARCHRPRSFLTPFYFANGTPQIALDRNPAIPSQRGPSAGREPGAAGRWGILIHLIQRRKLFAPEWGKQWERHHTERVLSEGKVNRSGLSHKTCVVQKDAKVTDTEHFGEWIGPSRCGAKEIVKWLQMRCNNLCAREESCLTLSFHVHPVHDYYYFPLLIYLGLVY